jgi:hypothetical protein
MLAGLRKLRSAGLRMILGGSISMENLLVLNNIPDTVLGQLWREEAPPFSRSEAKQYLARELAGHPALAHTTAVMALLPDLVPSHLDAAVNMLADAEVSSASEVELVMTNQVLPNIRRSFLQQFDERLAKHYPDEELRTAQDLLDQVARLDESGGTIDSTGLPMHWRRVLTKLQYDMFLRDAPGLGYRFSLNLLRQWWRATRGM